MRSVAFLIFGTTRRSSLPCDFRRLEIPPHWLNICQFLSPVKDARINFNIGVSAVYPNVISGTNIPFVPDGTPRLAAQPMRPGFCLGSQASRLTRHRQARRLSSTDLIAMLKFK